MKVINYCRKALGSSKTNEDETKLSPIQKAPKACIDPDRWGCGAIMHLLLFGSPPFLSEMKESSTVSKSATDLLNHLLCTDPNSKFDVSAALMHPWIVKSAFSYSPKNKRVLDFAKVHKHFLLSRLQNSVIHFASTRVLKNENLDRVKKLFEFMDLDADGEISTQDLIRGYKKMYSSNWVRAEQEIDQIQKYLDISVDGDINYSGISFHNNNTILLLEFMNANLHIQRSLNEEKLRQAYNSYVLLILSQVNYR